MAGNEKTQKLERQVSDFIQALKDRTHNLNIKANQTAFDLEHKGFETYMQFRDVVLECDSFAEVIQRRLDGLPEDSKGSLQSQLDELTIQELTLATSASLKFLKLISSKTLPIGSREVLIKELTDLNNIRKRLSTKKYEGKVPEETLIDQGKVEEILESVIKLAPSLLHFKEPKKKPVEEY